MDPHTHEADAQGPKVYPQPFKISHWQRRRLRQLAQREGVSVSAIIRRALAPLWADPPAKSE